MFCISAVAAAHSDVNVFSAIGVPNIFGVPAIAGLHAVASKKFYICETTSIHLHFFGAHSLSMRVYFLVHTKHARKICQTQHVIKIFLRIIRKFDRHLKGQCHEIF